MLIAGNWKGLRFPQERVTILLSMQMSMFDQITLPPPQCWFSLIICMVKKTKNMGNMFSISYKCYIWYPEPGSKNFLMFPPLPSPPHFFKLAF